MYKPYMNRIWLEEAYRTRSSREVAKLCGVHHKTILRWLHKFNIPVRPPSVHVNKYAICKKLPERAFKPSFELGYVLGVMMGDGSLVYNKANNSYRIILRTSSREFAEFFASVLEAWANLKLRIQREKRLQISVIDGRKVASMQYYCYVDSKIAYEFLKKQIEDGSHIPAICWENKLCLYGFLSGFFDSEGSIYTVNVRGYKQLCVSLANTNLTLIEDIRKALVKLGFHPTSLYIRKREKHKELGYFRLARRNEVLRFMGLVHGYKKKDAERRLDSLSVISGAPHTINPMLTHGSGYLVD